MHELSIVTEMLQVALEFAARENATRIAQFNIEMSVEANESEESLRFYFETLTRGTIAQAARVHIQRVDTSAVCHSRTAPPRAFRLVSIEVA